MEKEQYNKNLLVPKGNVDVVLDTDAYNEIDDQFALSYMMLSPERINIKATTEEHLGFTGEKLGIAAHAVCLLIK